MFGLIKDVIHAHKSTVIIYVIVVVLISLIAMWIERFDFLDLFIPGIPPVACVLFLPELYGRETHWHNQKATKKQVVGSKYVVFLMVIGLSFLVSLLLTMFISASGEKIVEFFRAESAYMGVSLILGATFLLLAHFLNKYSHLVIMLVSMLVLVGILALIFGLYSIISFPQSSEKFIFLAISCVLYIISYFVSVGVYKKREF